MAIRRIVPVAFIALAACSTGQANTSPQPLVPKAGPEARVRVEYDGGVFNRRLSALFTVKRPAYVMVAHLGGDGVIRVLFPEDARETGLVPAGKTFRTAMTSGDYDAAPGYWFMRPTLFRSMTARHDSYDGNGHGFVFMIASASPLHFDRVSEFGLWNEYELPDYVSAIDPRTLVRQYANLVSPGGKYTLDYASNISSFATYSYATHRMDCAIMSSFSGFTPWMPMGFGFGSTWLNGFHQRGFGSCFNQMDRRSYAYTTWRSGGATPSPVVPVTPGETEGVATPKPINPRDGRRNPLTPGRDPSNASSRPAGRRFDPDRRTSSTEERIRPAPTTPRRDESDQRLASPRDRDRAPREGGRRSETTSPGSSGTSGAAARPSSSESGSRSGDRRPSASEKKERSP